MVGDYEVIQNLIKQNHDLEGKIEELEDLKEGWKILFYEIKELLQDYRKILHSKEH